MARLQAIVAERGAWASQLMQIKRMHGWVVEVEHILDGSWAHHGEEVSNATVGSRLDAWREQMAKLLAAGALSELEQACLTEFLRVLANLRLYLVHCYDHPDFPRTNGYAERFVETFKLAVAERCRYETLGEFLRAAQQWVNFYNTTRLHEGLEYRSPAQFAQEHGLPDVPSITLF